MKTLTRKIVEEVMNITEHNKSWNKIRVITDLNQERTRFKATIKYDGGEYYDPQANNVGNVVGSTERFQSYARGVEISSTTDREVTIKVNIVP